MTKIAVLGEVLLDLMTTGVRLGGAPAAEAWYCAQMGAQSYLVSAFGKGEHGQRMQRELKDKHFALNYIMQMENAFTGEAHVHFDETGRLSYRFTEDVAWDHLSMTSALEDLAHCVNGVIFGTLAQRAEETRQTIYSFLDKTSPQTVRLLDLHLKKPYYNTEILDQSFARATAAKINQREIPIVARWLGKEDMGVEETVKHLFAKYPSLCCLAVTRGEDGSLLFDRQHVYECGGFYADQGPNPSGCAEVFCAVLCLGLINGVDLQTINEEANRAACCVCNEPDLMTVLSDEVMDTLQKANII